MHIHMQNRSHAYAECNTSHPQHRNTSVPPWPACLHELAWGAPIEEHSKLAAMLGGVVLVKHQDAEVLLLRRQQLLRQPGARLAEVGLACVKGVWIFKAG